MKLILFALSGFIAVFLSFFCFETKTVIKLYTNSIYWLISITLILWILSVIDHFKSDRQNQEFKELHFFKYIAIFFKNHWIALLLSLFFISLGAVSCKPDFLILADETNLLSDSRSLYESKKCFIDLSSFEYRVGGRDILFADIDKRPVLFPYLLSIIHSISGYRPENIFVLNLVTGFLSLFLIYYLIQLLYGKYWGVIGLISLASYPLFIVYTNSGGFDVFNLMCSLVFFVCLYKFIKSPTASMAEILLLWVPLLSQSRYESVLSLLIALPVVFYLLPRQEYSNLSYRFVLFPLLFIAPAWLRIATNDPLEWQVDKLNGGFGFNNLVNNFTQSLVFYFSGNEIYGVIPLISIIGIVGFICFLLEIAVKNNRQNLKLENIGLKSDAFVDKSFYCLFWSGFVIFYVLHAIAKFSYSLADLTELPAIRHGIIFIPFFIIMSVNFLARINYKYKMKKSYSFLLVCFLFFYYWPTAANSLCGVRDIEQYLEFKIAREYLEKEFPNKRDYLILTNFSNWYTPLGYSSVSLHFYKNFEDLIKKYYKEKYCFYYIVIQLIDAKSGFPYKGYNMPEGLDNKVIFERKFQNDYLLKISKCIPKEP